jgi:hypothetical protein
MLTVPSGVTLMGSDRERCIIEAVHHDRYAIDYDWGGVGTQYNRVTNLTLDWFIDGVLAGGATGIYPGGYGAVDHVRVNITSDTAQTQGIDGIVSNLYVRYTYQIANLFNNLDVRINVETTSTIFGIGLFVTSDYNDIYVHDLTSVCVNAGYGSILAIYIESQGRGMSPNDDSWDYNSVTAHDLVGYAKITSTASASSVRDAIGVAIYDCHAMNIKGTAINALNTSFHRAIGIEFWGSYAEDRSVMNMFGYAEANNPSDFADYYTCGIFYGGAQPKMLGCHGIGVNKSTGSAYGLHADSWIAVETDRPEIQHSGFQGSTGDVSLGGADSIYFYGNQYEPDSVNYYGNVSIIPQAGDRSAWDVPDHDTRHAKDIDVNILYRHLPAPGAGGNMVYDTGSNWVSDGGESVQYPHKTITANYTINSADWLVKANAAGGNIIITLPSASIAPQRPYYVKRIDSSSNTVTIEGAGADTIDEAANKLLSQYDSICLYPDGSEWWIL